MPKLKISLRERYKQADLEAIALKKVHRGAKTFLLTLSGNEATNVNKKILKGDVVGLEKVINCYTSEIDKLINDLKQYTIIQPTKIDIITGSIVSQGEISM